MTDFKKIYDERFSSGEYNIHRDDEPRFNLVKQYIQNNTVSNLVDIGTGKGNIIPIVQSLNPDVDILTTDLNKYHDYNVSFEFLDLCDSSTYSIFEGKKFDMLSCLDVMEHINKDDVNDVLELFSIISKYSLITIANHSDVQNGVELHLIQEDQSFWEPIINQFFEIEATSTEYGNRLYLYVLKSLKFK